ncbi:MAG: hypothetical protein AAGH78_14370 [Cyanobacteria bacterium P01_H01_bin.58]
MHSKLSIFSYLSPLLRLHAKVGQQPDNLCGPYWIALLLQAYGKLSTSAVEVSLEASTLLPSQGEPTDWLPTGATSCLGPGYDHIPMAADLTICGTSVTGLSRATEQLSQGNFCLIPLQTDDWLTGLAAIAELCQTHLEWQIIPLLNIHTRYLWGSQLTPLALFTYLQTGQLTSPPVADWSVGHFALLIGQLQSEGNTLYGVLDTYPHFGWNGLHLQPPLALAQALQRPDSEADGGIALFAATKTRSHLIRLLENSGFRIAPWDNGTPDAGEVMG